MGIIMKTIKRSYSSQTRKEDNLISKIHDFMDRHHITNYTINPDKSVDVNDVVFICERDLINDKLPFKFGKVTGSFYCQYLKLTSLEGCPKKVGGDFDCDHNELTTLEGCPEEVSGNFLCFHNQLTSLEGCPKIVGGCFYCEDNEKKFTGKEVDKYCKVKGLIWV